MVKIGHFSTMAPGSGLQLLGNEILRKSNKIGLYNLLIITEGIGSREGDEIVLQTYTDGN